MEVIFNNAEELRKACIKKLSTPHRFSTEDLAEFYCFLTGRKPNNYEIKIGEIKISDNNKS